MRRTALFVTLALATAWSPAAQGKRDAGFLHRWHVGDVDADCMDCHTKGDDESKPPLPSMAACGECHDDGPPETIKPPPFRRLTLVDFPHGLHADALECVDCHAATAKGERPGAVRLVEPDRCTGCHADQGAGPEKTDCAACHRSDLGKEKPADHLTGWLQLHPKEAETRKAAAHGLACDFCHGADPCIACHQKRKPLSHRLHLEERGVDDCDGCHVSPATPGPGLPTVDTSACEDCHDSPPQTELLRAPRARRLAAAFPHGRHVAKLKCLDCHQATALDEGTAGAPLVARPQCEDCHASRDVALVDRPCTRCHTEDKGAVRPADHDAAWIRRHGTVRATLASPPHGRDCTLCHAPTACRACHLSTRPADHTALWRDRMHGVAASWDRARCQQCHESGTCVGCHRRTPPWSHTGAWRMTHGLTAATQTDQRCTTCHATAWCADCHSGARRTR